MTQKLFYLDQAEARMEAVVEDESSTSSASPDDKRKNIFRNPEDLAQFVISGESR